MSTYQNYLDGATKNILSVVSAPYAAYEEKHEVISGFAKKLNNMIVQHDKYQDSQYLIDNMTLSYLDKKITWTIRDPNLSVQEYQNAIVLCDRMKDLQAKFKDRKWALPELSISNTDDCVLKLKSYVEITETLSEMKSIDTELKAVIDKIKTDGHVSDCEKGASLLDELEKNVNKCKNQKIPIPGDLSDIRFTRDFISRNTDIIREREELYQQIIDTDKKIENLERSAPSEISQWEQMISYCTEQRNLINKYCKKNKLPDSISYPHPEELIRMCKTYIAMKQLDEEISSVQISQLHEAQLDNLKSLSRRQQGNIDECRKNSWSVPLLKNRDMDKILDLIYQQQCRLYNLQEEREKRRLARRQRRKYYIIAAVAAVVIIGAIIGISSYQSKLNAVIIFSKGSNDYIGQNLSSVVAALKEEGFMNIQTVASEEGWEAGNTVLQVSLNNGKPFMKGDKLKANSGITVTYSSNNRTEVSTILNDWNKADYQTLVNVLNKNGFENIRTDYRATISKEQNHIVSGISINGQTYVEGKCYVPKTAQITIQYFTLYLQVGKSTSELFNPNNYKACSEYLRQTGFTNIHLRRLDDLMWLHDTIGNRDGTLESVSIGGVKDFKGTDMFRYDAEIIIRVHTWGNTCPDITEKAR